MSRTFALIPAAGKSTRMGRPKLMLPLGNRLVIERVINALWQPGIERVLVVVAPHVPELMAPAHAAGADVLMLAAETPDMRATVEAGLDWLEKRFAPRPDDAWLLVPADHPVLDAEVIRRLLQERADHSDCSIVIPAYAGRRGHPALIDWRHVAAMRAMTPAEGFNIYLRNHREETHEVLVDSPTVLLDLDTPEDYERLQETWEKDHQKGDGPLWMRFVTGLWFVGAGAVLGYLLGPISGGFVTPAMGAVLGSLIGRWVWSKVSTRQKWLQFLRRPSGE